MNNEECPNCGAHKDNWKETFGNRPCCEFEKMLRGAEKDGDKLLSELAYRSIKPGQFARLGELLLKGYFR